MLYSELFIQDDNYTYSANIQLDMDKDEKLAKFIPNETNISLLKEYFTDIIKSKPQHHARILYGSYGTGKSHFLTVLSILLSKSFSKSRAAELFLSRVREYDELLANDIENYLLNTEKPFLVVPIVFDFEDFDRCLYFSLNKKLESINKKVSFKNFYNQALDLVKQWNENDESKSRLAKICETKELTVDLLITLLKGYDKKAEKIFNDIFSEMTYGVKFNCEVANLKDSIEQANEAIKQDYSGIVFIFDEFGRYVEDNSIKIKVKLIQDIAEFCDHGDFNNHIILVSHKELSLYTANFSKSLANEWKKVEGRYRSTPIIDKQDQCLSLVRSVLLRDNDNWNKFKDKYQTQLTQLYNDAMDFHGIMLCRDGGLDLIELGYPLHPISLYILDRLSRKVAQNERTFFTYLASKEEKSIYSFLSKYEIEDGFHFVGVDLIFDYFEQNIKAIQSDESFDWYRKLLRALAKINCTLTDSSIDVKILKAITVIGIINDASAVVANRKVISSIIDAPKDIISRGLDELSEKKIIKYSGSYDRFDFFDSSIFDFDKLISDESSSISDESVVKTLNDEFIQFVLYPYEYNNEYKISRIFVPQFMLTADLSKKNSLANTKNFDGTLLFCLGAYDNRTEVEELSKLNSRVIFLFVQDTNELKECVKKYIAVLYLESQKAKYTDKDPSFEQELLYYKSEIKDSISRLLVRWQSLTVECSVFSQGECIENINVDLLNELASKVMFKTFSKTLIVNNELLNKNTISSSMTSAKKNAIKAILNNGNEENYFGLAFLSPEYISVRSVLYKNGFCATEQNIQQNSLTDGYMPQEEIKQCISGFMERAKSESVECAEVIHTLKEEPFGLRDGYLSLILAYSLNRFKKSLIISSYGNEQELTVDLLEELVHRPNDFSFTIASWSKKELEFLDGLEHLFDTFINKNNLSKNRLKAIYDGMFLHYKNVPKFSRTTQKYVDDKVKQYRKLLEKSYTNYSNFIFKQIRTLNKNYSELLDCIKNIKMQLDNGINSLALDVSNEIINCLKLSHSESLSISLKKLYETEWESKRNKSFDYYTNALLEFISKIDGNESDYEIILKLSKALTGFELLYWSDSHFLEFSERLIAIKEKLDSYKVKETLSEAETKMILQYASGKEKSFIFDNVELSALSISIKNKINSTFNNYGLSITYDDKVQILLSIIEDLMEGTK